MDARELYLLGLLVVIFPAAHGADHGMSNPTLTGCECTGDNLALGTAEMTKHGADYGKWCSAWEDGQCDSTATRGPAHTCKGNQASSCQAHWPSYDFDDDQSWCCDSWCYVSNITCTPEKQKQYGITIGESWTKTDLWFSYGACPDPFSGPKGVGMEDVSYSTYSEETCPYTGKADPELSGCECTGDNKALGEVEMAAHGSNYGKWCAVLAPARPPVRPFLHPPHPTPRHLCHPPVPPPGPHRLHPSIHLHVDALHTSERVGWL